jgi:hypothetical protein
MRPYDLQTGEWSKFRFRVAEQGHPSSGWSINEMLISDVTGHQLRVSAEDNGAFNRQFGRTEESEVLCVHRWDSWPGEGAWKFSVHFEHPEKPGVWAEYLASPTFKANLARKKN